MVTQICTIEFGLSLVSMYPKKWKQKMCFFLFSCLVTTFTWLIIFKIMKVYSWLSWSNGTALIIKVIPLISIKSA